MQWNTDPNNKGTTNSHLLNLLTKRSSKSVNNLNANWPGKHPPSLINAFPKSHKHSQVANQSQNSMTKTQRFNKSNYSKMIKSIPMIKVGSGSLSLVPTARSKSISLGSTWRTINNNKFFTLNEKNSKIFRK